MKAAPQKKTAYFCTNCGAMHHRWQGQCRECGQWNSLHEETIVTTPRSTKHKHDDAGAVAIPDISTEHQTRIQSGLEEFDRVLGGGAVYGSALLIGGEPGIGKSSLLHQVKERSLRFGIQGDKISVANLSDLDAILDLCRDRYQFLIIDSIQTVASPAFESPPGTVGQVRESSARLIELVKKTGKILLLVGHITKDGTVAGPKVLEHMVDTVLYFEGDRYHLFRILRAQKNRFGPSGEIGVFEMTGTGLAEVKNPSQIFVTGAGSNTTTGRVVSAAIEGSRSFLVEARRRYPGRQRRIRHHCRRHPHR
jgi:DNA repair protein RadA/Sms